MTLPEWFAGSSEEAGFLRLVLDHVSDCLVAVDTAGTIVLINEPYCKLLGGEADDFLGRHITDVVGATDQASFRCTGSAPMSVIRSRFVAINW
ncbi:PAS domain S-box protein [Rhizobium beringeri]